MSKGPKYKPSNKDRDSAISHLLSRIGQLEAMLQAQIEVFEKYMVFRKQDKKFNKYLTSEMEKQVEQHKLQEQNEETMGEDTKDKGRRAKGVCPPL
tara:strand:+ start:546 stop:833 length:288 start_codon:yes stop_codon:yes gene_type:complete